MNTLLCDASRRPLCLISEQQAVCRLLAEQSQAIALLSQPSRPYRSAGGLSLPAPLIISDPLARDEQALTEGWFAPSASELSRVSRRVLLARDKYTCQYCGWQAGARGAARELTMDHVKPACLFPSRGAASFWENVTTACRACNARKADSLPWQCGMYPATTPKQPSLVQLRFAGRVNSSQRDYIQSFFSLPEVEYAL